MSTWQTYSNMSHQIEVGISLYDEESEDSSNNLVWDEKFEYGQDASAALKVMDSICAKLNSHDELLIALFQMVECFDMSDRPDHVDYPVWEHARKLARRLS